LKKYVLIFLLFCLPGFTFSQEKDTYTIITLFDGPALRPPIFLNSTEASIEMLKSKGLEQWDQGISMNYEFLGKGNYSSGLKYYRTLFSAFPILYAAIQPCMYKAGDENGWNLRPEIGLLYDPIWQYVVGLRLKLDYAYDAPLSNQQGFPYSRSIIEFKVGITFNVHHKTAY
jgi:hypothetical protein